MDKCIDTLDDLKFELEHETMWAENERQRIVDKIDKIKSLINDIEKLL